MSTRSGLSDAAGAGGLQSAREVRLSLTWILSLLGIMLLTACGNETTGGSASVESAGEVDNGFVGTLDGTDAFVALVVSGSNAAVYACDGDGEIAEYFWGPVDDNSTVALDSLTGGSVHAELVDGAYTGTLTFPDGSEHAFTTERAVGDAGMYLVVGEQAVDAEVSAGWILDNNGAERGALIRSGSFEPTPKFDSGGLVLEDEGFAMTKLVIGTNDIVSPNNIISPNNIVSPNNIISPNNVLKISSPAGPIPIPFPNQDKSTETKSG
jgi:hypothetical protein